MASLELILIFVLLFKAAISEEAISLYKRPGHDVTLSCGSLSSADTPCSNITWFYNRELVPTITEIRNGNLEKNSTRAARLSLNSDCSLVINTITAEDAGVYTCRQGRNNDHQKTKYTSVYLGVLTIASFSPDADPKSDGEVILKCSLWRYKELRPCEQNSIRWVDETGTVLLGEGVGFRFLRQMNCVSYLNVKHQSGNNRRFTCQAVDQNKVLIEAEYTPVFTDGKGDDQTEKSVSDSTDRPLSYIILTLRVTGLILIIITTVLLMRDRGFRKPADKNNVHFNGDEVTYENAQSRPAATTLH